MLAFRKRASAGQDEDSQVGQRSWLRRLLDLVFGYDFFISYSWKDGSAYALDLARKLEVDGYEVFLDRDDYAVGDNWKHVGAWTLRRTGQLILVGSPSAMFSEPVLREVRIFTETGRRIIPVDFEGSLDADRASPVLPFLSPDTLRIREPKDKLSLGPSADALATIRRTFKILRQDKKRLRVMSGLVLVFAVVSLVAIAAGWQAEMQKEAAVEQAEKARQQSDRNASLRLAAEARELAATNSQRATLLAVEAVKVTRSQGYVMPAARAALEQALGNMSGIGLFGHTDNVLLAEFSDDEKLLATGGADKTVRIWTIGDTGLPAVSNILHQPDWPSTVLFDRTGRFAITHSRTGNAQHPAVVWRLESGVRYPKSIPLLDGNPSIEVLTTNREAGLLAAAKRAGPISIVSISDGSSFQVLRQLTRPSPAQVESLRFSRDGKVLIAGTDKAQVWVWNLSSDSPAPVAVVQTDLQLKHPTGEGAGVDIVGISDDHSTMFTGSTKWVFSSDHADPRLLIWRLEGLRPAAPPIVLDNSADGSLNQIVAGFFGRTPSLFITVTLDGIVREWDVTSASVSPSPIMPTKVYRTGQSISAAEMSPDLSRLALARGGKVDLLSVGETEKWSEASVDILSGFDGSVSFVRFGPSGRALVAGGIDDSARVWRLGPDGLLRASDAAFALEPKSTTESVLSDDGRHAVTLSSSLLKFWDLKDPLKPRLQRRETIDGKQHAAIERCLSCTIVLSRDQRWASVQSGDKDRSLLLGLDGDIVHSAIGIPTRTWRLTGEVLFSPDSRWLSVKAQAGSSLLYELTRSSETESPTEIRLSAGSYERSFSPDSKLLFFRRLSEAGRDRSPVGVLVPVTSPNDSKQRLEIESDAAIEAAVFSHTSSWLATSTNRSSPDRSADIRLVKLASSGPNSRVTNLSGGVAPQSLHFSPDDRWLLSASSSILLRDTLTPTRLWDLRSRNIQASVRELPGVGKFLRAVIFSPNSQLLLTIEGQDTFAKLWRLDLPVPKLIAELVGPQPALNRHWQVVFSPDSRGLVISTTDDPTPYFWRLNEAGNPGHAIAILNGDRAIQSLAFTKSGDRLVIFNSGGTTTGTSGSAGSHATIVDIKKLPLDTATSRLAHLAKPSSRATLRDDVGVLLFNEKTIKGIWMDADHLIRQAEMTVGRNLRLEEWVKAELPGAYRQTFPEKPVDARTLQRLVNSLPRQITNANKHPEIKSLVDWTKQLNDASLCNEVAWALVTRKLAQEAIDTISCGLRHFPDEPNFRDTRGVAAALLKQHAQAIADFKYYIAASVGDQEKEADVKLREKWVRSLEKGEDPFVDGIK